MHRLDNPVQRYGWGSTTAIPALLGMAADDTPVAELWLGAHPSSPSTAAVDGRQVPLDQLVAHDPGSVLGSDVRVRFGDRLPFLLKVLAADRSLSLQVHPDADAARRGYEREEADGVPADAACRCYRDPHHKPELLLALSPFDGLCGFRPVPQVLELLDGLAAPCLEPLRALLAGPDGLGACARRLLTTAPADALALVTEVREASARRLARGSRWEAEDRLVQDLAARHPHDPGVLLALMLNRFRLQPGEAVYTSPGMPHAYLSGVGVEVMACSDNVLRGGLTDKHVDVAQLMDVLVTDPSPVRRVRGRRTGPGCEVYDCGAAEFALSRVELDGSREVVLPERGPRVVLCLAGGVQASAGTGRQRLERGQSVLVTDADGPLALQGRGLAVVAGVGREVGSQAVSPAPSSSASSRRESR